MSSEYIQVSMSLYKPSCNSGIITVSIMPKPLASSSNKTAYKLYTFKYCRPFEGTL